ASLASRSVGVRRPLRCRTSFRQISAHSVTTKLFVVVAVPPAVAIVTFPVLASTGTVAVTSVSDFTSNSAATTPKLTFEVCERLTPVISTRCPAGPFAGENFLICGLTRNGTLVWSLPPLAVVTVILPVVAAGGSLVLISEFLAVNLAAVPLKLTLVEPFSPLPRMVTLDPTRPEASCVSTNGASPTDRLNSVPQPLEKQSVLVPP